MSIPFLRGHAAPPCARRARALVRRHRIRGGGRPLHRPPLSPFGLYDPPLWGGGVSSLCFRCQCAPLPGPLPAAGSPQSARVAGRSLTGKKKLFRNMVSSKNTACSSYVQPWLVAIASWRLAVGGWRRLAAVGGSWQLAVGGPLGRSLRAVLNKKIKLVP